MADATAVFKALADFSEIGTESGKSVTAIKGLESTVDTMASKIEGHLVRMAAVAKTSLEEMQEDMREVGRSAVIMAATAQTSFGQLGAASLAARGAGDNIRHVGTESSIAHGFLSSFASGVDTATSRLTALGLAAIKVGLVAGTALGVVGGAAALLGIKFNATKEQQMIAFTQLLGDAEKGEQALQDIIDVAAKTPFEQNELTNLVQKLLAGGIEMGEILDTSGPKAKGLAISIGDAVSALGGGPAELAGIGRAFTQIATKGRVQSEELLQIAERGIPVYKILQKQFNVTGMELTTMLRGGQISSEEFFEAFQKGVDEFGLGGAMERQSQSFMGRLSTLKDNAQIILGKLTEPLFKSLSSFLGVAGDALAGFTDDLKEGVPVTEAFAKNFPGLVPVFNVIKTVGGFVVEVFRDLFLGIRGFILALRDGDVTSDGFVGTMEKLGNFVRENGDLIKNVLLVALGLFLGGLTPVGAIIALLLINLDNLKKMWAEHGDKIMALAKNVGGDLLDAFISIWGIIKNLLPIFQGIALVIGGAIVVALPILSEAFKILAGTLEWITTILDGPLGVILGALAGTLGGITLAVLGVNKAFDTARKGIDTVHKTIDTGKAAWTTFGENIKKAGKFAGDSAKSVGGFAKKAGEAAAPHIKTGLSAVGTAFKGMGKAAVGALRAIGAAMIANPWILVIAAVVIGIILLIKHWDKVKKFVIEAWDKIKDAIGAAWEFIKEVVSKGIEIIKTVIITGLKLIAMAILLPFVPLILFITKFQEIKEAVGKALDFVITKLGEFIEWIKKLPGKLAEAAGNMFGWIWDKIKAGWDKAVEIGDAIQTWLTELPGRMIDWAGDLFGWIWDKIKAGWNKAVEIGDTIQTWLKELPGKMIGWAGDMFSWIWDKIKAGWNKAVEIGDTIQVWLSELPGKMAGWIGDAFAWIKTKFREGWNKAVEIGDDIQRWVGELPGRLARAGSGIWDWIKDAFKGAINFVIRAWNNLEFKIPAAEAFGVKIGGFTLGMPNIPEVRHSGGMIGGASSGADVFSMLQPGEFVMQRSAVKSLGTSFLNQLNSGASGGSGVTIGEINIHNPIGATAEESLTRSMQKLQYAGYFGE